LLILKANQSGGGINVDLAKNKLASRREILFLFSACVFPVHVWAIVNTLREVPSYILRLSLFEIASVFSYILFFALIESIVIAAIIAIISVLLPARLFKDFLVSQGSLFLFITCVWILPIHYLPKIVQGFSFSLPILIFLLWFWITSYIGFMGAAYILIRRRINLRKSIRSFVEKLAMLSLFYLFLDLVSIFIIVYRNIS
jgi:hypothetical protein